MGLYNFVKAVLIPCTWTGKYGIYLLWFFVLGGLTAAAIYFAYEPAHLIEDFVNDGGYDADGVNLEPLIKHHPDGFTGTVEDIAKFGEEVASKEVAAPIFESLKQNVMYARIATTACAGVAMGGAVMHSYWRLGKLGRRYMEDKHFFILLFLAITGIAGTLAIGLSGEFGYAGQVATRAITIGFCAVSVGTFVFFMGKDIYNDEYKQYKKLFARDYCRRRLSRGDHKSSESPSISCLNEKVSPQHRLLKEFNQIAL